MLSSSDKWADIEDLIRRWARKHPDAFRENMRWVASDREDYRLGRRDRPLRKGLLVHPHLMVYIQHFYPTFMDSNQDLREFSKRFPGFVVDEGVMPA